MEAKPIPVFPEVGSIIVAPGFNLPSCSAVAIMFFATLSFTLPAGFKYSSFTRSLAFKSNIFSMFSTSISGVFPISSCTFLYIFPPIILILPLYPTILIGIIFYLYNPVKKNSLSYNIEEKSHNAF